MINQSETLSSLTKSNIIDKLKKSEERFNLAMRGANDGLWDWDLLTDEVYYSPRWKKMLGYEDSELDNHINTWKTLVDKRDKERVLIKVSECIKNKDEGFEVEMKMNHKNGSSVIILSRAFLVECETDRKISRIVGTHVDITQRYKSEEFMKQTNRILEMIAVGKPASDIYNQIALMYESRHLGMRCSLLEMEDGILLHGGAPSMPIEYREAVHGLKIGADVGSCGSSTFTGCRVVVEDIQTDPKWKNIKQFALPHGMRSCWSEPIIDSKGKVLGAFGMYYDYPSLPNDEESKDLLSAARLASIVMERDQSQKRIHKDQKLISEQSKLASMGEMIGNIAHQWRQPLSVISTSATGAQLQNELGLLDENNINLYFDTINTSVQYLSQTIEDFRGYFDPRNSKLKKIIISNTIEKALKIVSSKYKEEDIKVVLEIEDIDIVSQDNELIQVLVNIFNNSRDAFLDFGNKNKFVFINSYMKEESLFIEVKDNAGGITEDIIDRVFEPYFTTKYQKQGTGIGLFMCQDIVRTLLEGDIKVENETFTYLKHEYKGAKFTIILK